MKKRYARILAATLSAAMVFTSAPVNFTGINTGVIEAQAAAKDYNSVNAAVQACESILNSVKWNVKYSVFAGDGTNDTIQKQVNAAIAVKATDLSNAGFAVTAEPVTAADGAKDKDAARGGSFAFKITATWTNTTGSETLQLANRTFEVQKDAPAAGYADFNTVTADYVMETITTESTAADVLAKLTNTKDAKGDTVVAADNGYDIVADSLTGLKAVNVSGTVYDLVFRKFVDHDADVVDYASAGGFTSQGGKEGYFEKTIKVTVKGSVASLTDPVPGHITYDFGDSKVKLTGTTNDNYKVVGYINEDLPKVAANTLNVKLEAKATTDVKAVDVAATLSALQAGADATTNAWKSTWSFDYATNKFNVIMPMPSATLRVVNIKDIVWPTKLKDGTTTVPYLTQLSTVELEETATSKAGLGKFVLVYHKDDTHTDAKKEGISDPSFKKYCIQFVPTATKVEVKNPAAGGTDHYGAGDIVIASSGDPLTAGTAYAVAIEKKNALAVTTAKSVIAAKDIDATYKGVDDDTKYGTTYANIAASVTFPQASLTAGSYTLKDAKDSDLLKPGKNTITYVYKVNDSDRYEIEGGAATKEVSFDVTVKQPVLKATVSPTVGNSNFVKVGPTKKTVLQAAYAFDNVRNGFAYLNPANDLKITKYQWSSESKGEIFNATLATYTVNATAVMTDGFSCAITAEVKTGVDAAKAEMYKTLLGNGTLTSDPLKVYVTNMDVTRVPADGALANQTFGAVNATASALIGLDSGFTMKSVTWTLENKATKEKVEVAGKIAANNTISCDLPKDTQVGEYKLSAAIVAASASEEQTAVVDYSVKVTKATLAGGSDEVKLLAKINVAEADKSVKYGTKLKDIKLAIPEGSEKFGTYQWLNGETYVSSEEATYTVRFIANDFARRNYTNWDTVAGDVKVAGTQNYTISGIRATKKADLVIKADDIVVEIGKTAPEGTYTATGLVGTDTVASLGLVVKVEADSSADLTKVGTYTGAAVVVAKHGDKTNENINDLENYNVTVEAGNVIVKAATVAPSTAPTTAPTATPAPAVKAANATVSVKAGKSVTLKLKNAPKGAKVTWSLDKKAKKALKVSKKGKVTVKKGAKKGTYKVYAKVNGKKVTFKVKVK